MSEELRVTPKEIRDYFDVFAKLPGLKVRVGRVLCVCARACLCVWCRLWWGGCVWA